MMYSKHLLADARQIRSQLQRWHINYRCGELEARPVTVRLIGGIIPVIEYLIDLVEPRVVLRQPVTGTVRLIVKCD
jgi:hypothetical protein